MIKTASTPSARILFLLALIVGAFAAPAFPQGLSVWVEGNTIRYSTPAGYGCGGATLGPDFTGGASCSAAYNCDQLPPHTGFFSCNRPGTYVVTGCWYDNVYCKEPLKPTVCGQATVTVTEPAPPTCPLFELIAKSSRVLAHKYGPENWPANSGQTQDAQLEMTFKPVRVDSGTPIYVKVFDPPDTSTYRPNPQPDDNFDSAAGTVSLSPSSTGTKELTFTASDDPIKIYLHTTDDEGGDNYVVKASADPDLFSNPNYACGAGCKQTNTITVWKRVYLERKRMFRNGVMVAGLAQAGATQVLIEIPRDRRWSHVRLDPGDTIRLVHAPRYDGLDMSSGFHSEDALITDVDRVAGNRRRRLLTLSAPLTHSYTNDLSYPDALLDGVSDGAGNTAYGTFPRNEAYIGEFNKAFVELFPAEQSNTEIPFLWFVRRPIWVANKWFENTPVSASGARRGKANVKHVLAGSGLISSGKLDIGTLGQVDIPGPGTPPEVNDCWTWVRAIEAGNQYTAKLDKWNVNGENVVHELAHTFSVNYQFYDAPPPLGAGKGHCAAKTMVANPALFCTMSRANYENSQNGDDVVGFHYSADDDSEYMKIRRNSEPVPLP